MSSVNLTSTNTSSVHSTPSNKGSASRNQSGNAQNLSPQLREDLVHDVLKAKRTDLDAILKFNLFLVMNPKSQGKQSLDYTQKEIETLERQIDEATRAVRAHSNQSEVTEPDSQLRDGGPSSIQSFESLKKDLDVLIKKRQTNLDKLLSECLDQVLPICNDDQDLRGYLEQYSQAQEETEMYAPFVRLCNHALDHLALFSSNTFSAANPLDCRFHVNESMPIMTSYKGQPSVASKPDVVITSAVAAKDVAHSNGAPSDPVFDNQPKNAFEMRQILGCVEFKFKKDSPDTSERGKSKKGKFLTTALSKYDKERQSECFDEDLVESHPVDASGSKPNVSSMNSQHEDVEVGGRPAKRKKVDGSELATISSGTRRQSSRGKVNPKGTSSRLQALSSGPKGSQGRKGPSNEITRASSGESKHAIEARSQCAQYGMEMLSHALGVHRAITFLIHNCKLWVWYYDRQGIIQSNVIDFIQDLPRFLVLLFTFQRFSLTDWGIMTELNPGAYKTHNENLERPLRSRAPRANVDDRNARNSSVASCLLKIMDLDAASLPLPDPTKLSPEEIEITFDDWLSHPTHQLAGRATAVLGCKVPGDETYGALVCKISFPEVARQNEGKTIERIRKCIESKEESKPLLKHLPKVLTYGDMARYGTQRIRSMMGLDTNGCRTLRVLLSERRLPLTTLVGADFVKAWLEAVKFHAYLWAIGWEHGDPSLWNVMYDDNLKCGVLSDYDLSICHHDVRMPGTERTGTIPFMALELLTDEYWRGEVARHYRHELEAFIWILPFVFLAYQDKKFQPGTLVEKWMTSDYEICREKKTDFYAFNRLSHHERQCQDDFIKHWPLPRHLLKWLGRLVMHIDDANISLLAGYNGVDGLWPRFIKELEDLAEVDSTFMDYLPDLIAELQLHRILTVV